MFREKSEKQNRNLFIVKLFVADRQEHAGSDGRSSWKERKYSTPIGEQIPGDYNDRHLYNMNTTFSLSTTMIRTLMMTGSSFSRKVLIKSFHPRTKSPVYPNIKPISGGRIDEFMHNSHTLHLPAYYDMFQSVMCHA